LLFLLFSCLGEAEAEVEAEAEAEGRRQEGGKGEEKGERGCLFEEGLSLYFILICTLTTIPIPIPTYSML
jgi:hypothetical protein